MLDVENLHAHYGRAHILHGVTLTAREGEVLALLGRNGAGKSTTLKSIVGLVRPAAGTVRFEGRPIAGLPPHAIVRRGLGYVPEDRRVFTDLTVMENLAVGRRDAAPDRTPWTPERLFGIFPNLAEMRHRRAGAMSGGEQQMLTIARTLMGNPEAVLLDEPSEGLAPVIVEQMAEAVLRMKEDGIAVLVSEQSLDFAAAVADRALILEKGSVRWQGPIATLEADEDIRRAYLTV